MQRVCNAGMIVFQDRSNGVAQVAKADRLR